MSRLNSRWALVPALAGLLLTSGCFNQVLHASPGAYVDTKVSRHPGQTFRIKSHNNYGFWGIAPRMKYIAVDELVSRKLGRPVKNISGVRIVQYRTVGNMLAQIATLGLFCPRTLVVEGVIHETRPPDALPPEPVAPPPMGTQ
jgi:hypothetical protein